MNQMERDFRPDGLADLEYLDGEYRVVRPGLVRALRRDRHAHSPGGACATGASICRRHMHRPIIALKRFQEAGFTPR